MESSGSYVVKIAFRFANVMPWTLRFSTIKNQSSMGAKSWNSDLPKTKKGSTMSARKISQSDLLMCIGTQYKPLRVLDVILRLNCSAPWFNQCFFAIMMGNAHPNRTPSPRSYIAAYCRHCVGDYRHHVFP